MVQYLINDNHRIFIINHGLCRGNDILHDVRVLKFALVFSQLANVKDVVDGHSWWESEAVCLGTNFVCNFVRTDKTLPQFFARL